MAANSYTGAWALLVGLVDDMELLNAALTEVQEETSRRNAGDSAPLACRPRIRLRLCLREL